MAPRQAGRLRPSRGIRLALAFLILLVCGVPPGSRAQTGGNPDLTSLSLEELMNVQLTSVLRKGESLAETPAPVTVITAEDIRRSGAISLPDLLRLVPGMDVAQIDSHSWAISARGYNNRYAGKLLVLVDGRSVYTPLFSGVLWETQDVVIEDVERIEVIRGPGGTLWGANAVNGIINIVTKPARDTQGSLVSGLFGSEDPLQVVGRYGGHFGNSGAFRVYAKGFRRDALVWNDGSSSRDDWNSLRGGFRADWKTNQGDDWTLLGEGSRGLTGLWAAPPLPDGTFVPQDGLKGHFNTAFLVTRWQRRPSPSVDYQFQGSFDYFDRNDGFLGERLQAVTLDFQNRLLGGKNHKIVWGLGARFAMDRAFYLSSSFGTSVFAPEKRNYPLWSAFFQDQWRLNSVNLFLGVKLENNPFTGLEVQPSVRASWMAGPQTTLWGAVSRGIRTPSRMLTDTRVQNILQIPFPPATVITEMNGNPDLPSEVLLAYEAGFRWNTSSSFSFEAAVFYNDYDNLTSVDSAPPEIEFTPQGLIIHNKMLTVSDVQAATKGLEVGLQWSPRPKFVFKAGVSYLKSTVTIQTGKEDDYTPNLPENDPRWQGFLQTSADLGPHLELGLTARHTGELEKSSALAGPAEREAIPSYTEVDLRLAWKPRKGLELALLGRNLLHDDHAEFRDTIVYTVPTRVQRSLALKLTWSF